MKSVYKVEFPIIGVTFIVAFNDFVDDESTVKYTYKRQQADLLS